MKHFKIILTLFLTAFVFQVYAQSALHDAIQLSYLLEDNAYQNTLYKIKSDDASSEETSAILINYLDEIPEDPEEIETAIRDGFFGNPFLGAQQGSSIIYLPDEFHFDGIFRNGVDKMVKAPAPSSGMMVTNIADGLSRFLVTRTKQELSIAFFRDFQKKVQENPYLYPLFPETAQLLSVIGEEIYQFNGYIGSLQESFKRDLKVLPTNMEIAVGNDKFNWLNDRPEMRLISSDLLHISQMLIDGQTPTEFIHYLGSEAGIHHGDEAGLSDAWAAKTKNLSAAFNFVEILSNSLRSDDYDQIWFNKSQIQRALSDKKVLYLYLALVYQKSKKISFSNGRTLQKAFTDIAYSASTVDQIKSALISFGAGSEGVQPQFRGLQPTNESAPYETYYQYFSSLMKILESGAQIRKLILPDAECDQMEAGFLHGLGQMNELNLNVRQRHYSLAVTNLVNLLDYWIGQEKFKPKYRDPFLKYAMFMASVSEADSPEEVQLAIEAFALPAGSSAMKKHAAFSISLNAYTGFGYAREHLEQSGDGNAWSVVAPVGIGCNFGLKPNKGSLSIYATVIDVGAITAYRFNSSNTASLPALQWSNILAPGGFLVYGLPWDIPVSFGFGAQMGPNLRKVDINGVPNIEDRGWRVQGFIGVDIPIVHFYTKK